MNVSLLINNDKSSKNYYLFNLLVIKLFPSPQQEQSKHKLFIGELAYVEFLIISCWLFSSQ